MKSGGFPKFTREFEAIAPDEAVVFSGGEPLCADRLDRDHHQHRLFREQTTTHLPTWGRGLVGGPAHMRDLVQSKADQHGRDATGGLVEATACLCHTVCDTL